jgi:hypothetical protein
MPMEFLLMPFSRYLNSELDDPLWTALFKSHSTVRSSIIAYGSYVVRDWILVRTKV